MQTKFAKPNAWRLWVLEKIEKQLEKSSDGN
jgi:hypothetical protein